MLLQPDACAWPLELWFCVGAFYLAPTSMLPFTGYLLPQTSMVAGVWPAVRSCPLCTACRLLKEPCCCLLHRKPCSCGVVCRFAIYALQFVQPGDAASDQGSTPHTRL
jgi:hypothetical protein